MNAKAATKNKALLAAINSGKTPKFSGSSQAAFLHSNAYSPTVNVHVEGGAADRQLAARIANHVNEAVNKSARSSAIAARSNMRRRRPASAARTRRTLSGGISW